MKKQISITKNSSLSHTVGSTDIFIVYLTILNHFVLNLSILHILCQFGPLWGGGGGGEGGHLNHSEGYIVDLDISHTVDIQIHNVSFNRNVIWMLKCAKLNHFGK